MNTKTADYDLIKSTTERAVKAAREVIQALPGEKPSDGPLGDKLYADLHRVIRVAVSHHEQHRHDQERQAAARVARVEDDLLPVLIRDADARKRAGGISRSTLHRWTEQGLLPEPVRIHGQNFRVLREFDAALEKLIKMEEVEA